LKENNHELRLVYPKIILKIKEYIKTFHTKQKLKGYMTTTLALQKIFKGILHTEEGEKYIWQSSRIPNEHTNSIVFPIFKQ
jgi:hypothetical protein